MLLQRGPGQSLDAKTFPCILGPVDRYIGHLTEVGWPVQWSVGLGCRGQGWRAGWRRAAFLAPVWGVGVVRGAGRRILDRISDVF